MIRPSLSASYLETKLGPLLAIANDEALLLLDFVRHQDPSAIIARFQRKMGASITMEKTTPIISIESEITHYFEGSLIHFNTPTHPQGSPFQTLVWQELQRVPFGQTKSYADIAAAIGHPKAFRAVARANSTNPIAIVIPCHRVINSNGKLGGYNGGIERKQWLLGHERKVE